LITSNIDSVTFTETWRVRAGSLRSAINQFKRCQPFGRWTLQICELTNHHISNPNRVILRREKENW